VAQRALDQVGRSVLNIPPVITVSPISEKRYSPRYLSEDERVRLADLRREKRTMREIAFLLGRSPSTILDLTDECALPLVVVLCSQLTQAPQNCVAFASAGLPRI
jgi:hypothetical protein